MFLSNKQTTEYYFIINNAIQRVPQTHSRKEAKKILGYTESHHIIPSCLGGSDDLSNRVWLTAAEHLTVHILLTQMVDNEVHLRKVHLAAVRMVNPQNKTLKRITGDENIEGFAEIRVEAARLHSKYMKEKHKGKNNPMFGKHHSDKSKEAKRIAMTGLVRTDNNKKKCSVSKMGDLNPSREVVTCPKCGKTGLAGGMRKHHFDHCTSHIIYHFLNKNTDEKFSGNRDQFIFHCDGIVTSGSLSNLIHGRDKSIKGWTIVT